MKLRRKDLLEAIYLDPDDDEPRLVYADWLQERGDAHGELIALQCARGRAQPACERELELLELGKDHWLGSLSSTLQDAEFARGFAARGRLERGGNLEALEWFTVEELTIDIPGWHVTVGSIVRFLTTRALHTVRGVTVETVVNLLEGPPVERLRRIELRDDEPQELARLAASAHADGLPALEELVISSRDPGREVLQDTPLFERLVVR